MDDSYNEQEFAHIIGAEKMQELDESIKRYIDGLSILLARKGATFWKKGEDFKNLESLAIRIEFKEKDSADIVNWQIYMKQVDGKWIA